MFSKQITSSDAFVDMPASSQLLYFHLNMEADDDGFIANPKKVMRGIGASDDDYKILIAKRFLITFNNGVVVIKHWFIHNYIQKDRYHETKYLEQKNALFIKPNGSYTECVQDVSRLDTEIRLDKTSIDKTREEDSHSFFGEFKKVKLTDEEHLKLIEKIGEGNTSILVTELDGYIASKGKDPYRNHYAVIQAWARRKLAEYKKDQLKTKGKQIV